MVSYFPLPRRGVFYRQIWAHMPPLAAVFVRAHLGMFSAVPD
jgi:hypothetical protein